MKKKETESDAFLDHFARYEDGLNGQKSAWPHELRREGIEQYRELGLPTRKNEEWKYTNVSPLARQTFTWSGSRTTSGPVLEEVDGSLVPALDGPRLVFVNGRFDASLSTIVDLPEGVTVGGLASELKSSSEVVRRHLTRVGPIQENPFLSLNTGFLGDGAFVHVSRGCALKAPIHLLFITKAGGETIVDHPRSLVVLDADASASVFEHYIALEGDESVYFTNSVAEAVVGPNARLEWLKLQQESRKAFHISSTNAHQSRDSVFTHHSISLGGLLTRNDINVKLDAPGIECHLNGFFLATGDQLVDHHTLVDHAKPHCNSWELYKGVLDGKAEGVFNGKIHVHQEAQKTDAKQSNRNLLLSEDAVINTKPQLQIYADDVKCTHGATVGRLDHDALHYLRCRGIGEAQARRMLIQAFAGEVLQEIAHATLREHVENLVDTRMHECEGLYGRASQPLSLAGKE